ncbi:hypothetical protein [Streptomyces sp. NRRL F-6628]|uniref:hypothetical protein n=1 Tax=Streptomyces sp. NRRL F-6628 TaxID=1463876 RepID=UPI00068F7790|nr:hypothetical protein [Streptomyces sp. NRRL F-6628]
MMLDRSTVPPIPEDRTFTVDQLTPQDYAAVCAFLADRLRELVVGGQEAAARVIDEAVSLRTDTLGPNFQWEADYPHEPVPDNWLTERLSDWNQLVILLWAGWHDADGYDQDRWRLVSSPVPQKEKAGADAPSDPAAHVLNSEGYAEWKERAGREGDALREEFLSRAIRRPEEADEAPLSWRSDKVVVYGSVLAHNGVPRTPANENLWRGTAADALSVLAAGESIRRTILTGRAKHIHQGLMLGTTWSEIAEALGRTPDQVRAELRYWADENSDLYYGADKRVPVAALLDLGDDETVPAREEDR